MSIDTNNRFALRVTPHDKDQIWSFQEVKELRQSGKLDEALQMANQALELEPENIWAKRAAAWVYYDYLKKSVQSNAYESFKENLIKVKNLQLPEDEKMVFDNCAWQIGSMVFGLQKSEHVDYGKIDELFEIIRDFHFTKPSEQYSFIYKAFHKGYQNWSNYLTFADWWNFDNLRSEDYLREEYGGKKMMSIAEQAYIAYCKTLLEYSQVPVDFKEFCNSLIPNEDEFIYENRGVYKSEFEKSKDLDLDALSSLGFPEDLAETIRNDYKNYLEKFNQLSFPNRQKIASWKNWKPFYLKFDKNKALNFLPKLDLIIKSFPDFHYLPYFKAKLLLKLGEAKDSLSAFIPFAKQKRNEFWVWELMAEIFSEDKEIQFACYCKALSLKTSEDFLVKLRQTFAEVLIEKSMYNEAKTEIQKVIATREQHEWRLPNKIVQWTEQEWYKSAKAQKDNLDLYSNHIKQAEEILFQDIPEEVIAVEFVNENRRILNFVKDKQKHGFFNYSGILTKPRVGDLLKVRFNGDGQDGFYKILTAKKIDLNTRSGAIKNFEGTLKVISQQNFGFVEDVYIDPKRIEEKRLSDGETLRGKAILSFNKKKNEWGWKAIEIK